MNRNMNRDRKLNQWMAIGFYLAAVAWFGLIVLGLALVTRPETGRHSHLAGWTALIIGATVFWTTMDRWIRHAQVFLGGGILGGVTILITGHLMNSQKPFPRLASAVMILTLIGCSLIVGTLAERRLRLVDRVGLVAFGATFLAAGAGRSDPMQVLLPMIAGFAILLMLWASHRFMHAKGARRRSATREPEASDLQDA